MFERLRHRMAPRSSPLGAPPAPTPSSTPAATPSTPSAAHHLSSPPLSRLGGPRPSDGRTIVLLQLVTAARRRPVPRTATSSSRPGPRQSLIRCPYRWKCQPSRLYARRSGCAPSALPFLWVRTSKWSKAAAPVAVAFSRPAPTSGGVCRWTSGANASIASLSFTELLSVVGLRDVSAAWSPGTARPVVRVGLQRRIRGAPDAHLGAPVLFPLAALLRRLVILLRRLVVRRPPQ
jgi:hypothetical protein